MNLREVWGEKSGDKCKEREAQHKFMETALLGVGSVVGVFSLFVILGFEFRAWHLQTFYHLSYRLSTFALQIGSHTNFA
jgi:hypothetical protein